MAKKKPENDVAADFFGDSDLDWLDDEEDAGGDDKERLPVAPPPPPPFHGQARTASPLETPVGAPDPAQKWADQVSEAPKDKKMSSAPTLIFSSVPTLPPGPAPMEEEIEQIRKSDPGAALDAGGSPPMDIPTSEQPTQEIERPDDDLEPPTEPHLPAVDSSEVFGDALDEQVVEETPLVRSHDPAPERAAAPPPAPAVQPPEAQPDPTASEATVAVPDSELEAETEASGTTDTEAAPEPSVAPSLRSSAFEPLEGAAAWRAVQQVLVAEAAIAPAAGRAVLLEAAARIADRRVSDTDSAAALYLDASAAAEPSPQLLRDLSEVLGRLGRFEEQASALARAGASSEGVPRTEALLEAGLVEWRRLNHPAKAVEHLRGAAAAHADDYISRALLRALLPSVGATDIEERLALLGELAGMAEGGIAADAHLEAAQAAQDAGKAEVCLGHLKSALVAEPGHTDAFLRLEAALQDDPAGLADLYDSEARRAGQTDPGWWRASAARAWQAAGRGDAAVEGFTAAVDAGYTFALRELQGGYARAGAYKELEHALAQEADALTDDEARAFALYRLGWMRETRLDDAEGALEAYRSAVSAAPLAAPASDAVARMLDNSGDQRRVFWEERLETASESIDRRFINLGLAEAAEDEGDQERARHHFELALTDGGEGTAHEVAIAGLQRVLHRLGDTAALATLRAEQSTRNGDSSDQALWLYLAAMAGAEPTDPDRALEHLNAALDVRPDHPAALHAATLLLEAKGDWKGLAERLREAGDASEAVDVRASYLYRAGRLFGERAEDTDSARACLEHALLAAPRFRPARWLLRTLDGGFEADTAAQMHREEAEHAVDDDIRAWHRFAAALAAGTGPDARTDFDSILETRPSHPGALAALEVRCVAEGDHDGLVALYVRAASGDPTPGKARLCARAAQLHADAGNTEASLQSLRQLAGMEVEGRPLRALSKLALKLGARDVALELLSSLEPVEDAAERARLLSAEGKPAEALPELMALLDTSDDPVGVGSRAATVAQLVGDADAMLQAYVTIARRAKAPALIAAYGAWTGMQLQGSGNEADALEFWQRALEARPTSVSALSGAVRGLIANQDSEGVQALLTGRATPQRVATALIDAGDPASAVEILQEMLGSVADDAPRKLSILAELERLFEEAGQWQEAYDALAGRRELCQDASVLSDADSKRRWVLAEQLAETDAAWDLYRELHDDAPEDREVTEALARIAGARGEVALGIGYLKELADASSEPAEAARYQRRIGEVYERAGQGASARQAYLDALDHVPSDGDALDGLKRLCEQEEDWQGLVAVLQREAGLADAERTVELRRSIARITEDRLGDPGVAIDAWRALAEIAPQDKEGLEHLLALAEKQGEWGVFVETGTTLAETLDGAERGALLRRVGVACEEKLGRDDAVDYYERAVAVEPPDFQAAQRLEALARGRADWDRAVRALSLQAKADVPEDDQILALLSAARIEVEARHDREAAADVYRAVLAVQPENETALRFMASHLFETGRFDEALPVCKRLEPMVEEGQDLDDFDTRMELSSFHFYFAEMLRLQSDEESALPRYERALELNPTHLPSLEAVGPLYTAAEQWKKAERIYRSLLQLSGGQGDRQKVATTYTQLGLVERQLGNIEKAYKRFNKALELHANHVGALKGMALVLEDREDWSNLLNVYNNIIYHATVPDDVIDAYMTKGRILDDHMQRQDKAAQHYQRSLDFDPSQPVAYLRLAELAMRRDAYPESGELAEKALQLDEDLVVEHRPLLLLIRAAAWQDAGRTAEGERCVREARMRKSSLVEALGDAPLADLEQLRQTIKDHLPLR